MNGAVLHMGLWHVDVFVLVGCHHFLASYKTAAHEAQCDY